jgi:hypothetical protein
VHHVGSATGSRIGDRKLYLIQRNMAIVTRRWFGFDRASATWLLSSMREAYYLGRAALSGRIRVVGAAKRDALQQARAADHVAPDQQRRLRSWIGCRFRPLRADGHAAGRYSV